MRKDATRNVFLTGDTLFYMSLTPNITARTHLFRRAYWGESPPQILLLQVTLYDANVLALKA